MGVNDLAFNQLATVLNSIVGQATGVTQITPADESQFISVAHIGLSTGYDPLMTAVSQVLSKTIFSVRPYTAKFKGLMVDETRYGNIVRKLTTIDKPWTDDERFSLTDGQSIDMFKVNKPMVLETRYTGANIFHKSITLYKDQLDVSFNSSSEFGRFISMIMQNVSDMIEQAREEMARNCVANLIAGTVYQEANSYTTGCAINLLKVYEDETGVSLTSSTVKDPQYFAPFARWLFGFLKTLSDRLAERSALYHQNYAPTGGTAVSIMRHTPIERQKCYLYSPLLNNVSANVLSTVFYDKYLKLMDHQDVSYWQSFTPGEEMEVTCKPSVTDNDFAVVDMTNVAAIDQDNVFGIIFDEEAATICEVNQWSAASPFNSAGGYTNLDYHFTIRWTNDFSENHVVLLLQNDNE